VRKKGAHPKTARKKKQQMQWRGKLKRVLGMRARAWRWGEGEKKKPGEAQLGRFF
jgi:hypothetical protein